MKVAKFIVSLVTAGAIGLTAALSDDALTTTEIVTIVLAVLGAAGVYVVPNREPIK